MSFEITFLGTGSANPHPHRGVSAIALKLNTDGSTWLFDCGEGTQIQFIRASNLKMGRVRKIFITHLHGDHLFGLPGLMCTLSAAFIPQTYIDVTPSSLHHHSDAAEHQPPSPPTIEIYGPKGLRRYLRINLQLSRSELSYHYVVHELMPSENQMPARWESWVYEDTSTPPLHPQECDNGRDISHSDGDIWPVVGEGGMNVVATWLHHRVPSYAYVLEEHQRPGKIDMGKVGELRIPRGPILGRLKLGEPVTLDDGRTITSDMVMGVGEAGRKIVIMGDVSGYSPSFRSVARGCHLLIHEATVENELKEQAVARGHSTPDMASQIAVEVECKHLVLTHVSQRYSAPPLPSSHDMEENTIKVKHSDNDVRKLLVQAEHYMKSEGANVKVTLAQDFLTISLPYKI